MHPFVTSIIGVVIILFLGTILVLDKSATSPSDSSAYTWGKYGSGRLTDITANQGSLGIPAPLEARYTEEDFYALLSDTRDKPYASLIPKTNVYESRFAGTTTNSEITFNADEITELLASISPTAQIVAQYNPLEDEFLFSDIYAFVPAKVAPEEEEPTSFNQRQRDLHDYGNEAGSYIQSFSERWRDQSQILKQFIEDIGNEEKAMQVDDLSFALIRVGIDLENMDIVPDDAQGAHTRLVSGYKSIGQKLASVASARSDEELLNAVIAYNEAADDFAEDYLSVVTLISVAEVSFSSSEPGSIFVFKPSLTL
ncbi:hypothetical protein COU13_01010 [Candidatus Kaiserbacteria bacterium CG10_big_fil_rev_8_21_14_0_10_43_70]|uniref:Uncharacterized protein n=1 Tax=Candidatus Kaiserbacteria bacterium CG10_big_fil_rev_8_21_14_0_10_43_70 TaxID=1974605 RepID=A0A2H0UJ42_9BACT|nr:MAG: hypothetical protein COU13_01010 [Candidatus Kaiserbacteria bacterium CG10_big_fil_rev_8_21_14_0_10_43_70]